MKTIKIDFRKYPERAEISANFKLSEEQKYALESLPPEVDILNLDVELDGHHIVINNASCQYYNNQEHRFSNNIPMTHEEIDDMIYHTYGENINEYLINRIEENG